MTGQLGSLIMSLRLRKHYSQSRMAEKLCEVSGLATVTRSEVSRWERQERVPSRFWLKWIAKVLEVPLDELESVRGGSVRSRVAVMRMEEETVTGKGDGAGESLPRVSLRFEHEQISVQFSATYDDPVRAISAIATFRAMVDDGVQRELGGDVLGAIDPEPADLRDLASGRWAG